MLRGFTGFLLFASFAFGQFIPGRFVIELNQPVADKSADGAVRARAAQAPMRARLAAMGVQVRESLTVTTNALIADLPEGTEGAVAAMPGVVRLSPVRQMKVSMDATPVLLQADSAWRNFGGADKAGQGIKIGIIDTGIDNTHPAFQDASLKPPAGFPRGNTAFTNSKVIVARSYFCSYQAGGFFGNCDESTAGTPRDQAGHGTSVAMAAAGVVHASPRGQVSGMAPKAFLGNYRASAPGNSGSFNGDVVMKAFEDAVADGMDVINLSLGSALALRPEFEPFSNMVASAAARGIVVVVAAGNEGPGAMTVGDLAQAPLALSVGATTHGRTFTPTLTLADSTRFAMRAGSNSGESTPRVAGALADIAPLDATSLGCDPLPAGSLAGAIALIQRGACDFAVKIRNAAGAGAVGVIIYLTQADPETFPWSAGTATTPAGMLNFADGQRLKALVAGGPLTGTLDFSSSVPSDFRKLAADFSSIGPSTGFTIKPEVVTIGSGLYTAATGGGYRTVSGTSLSAPIVSGTVAFLKSARPNLTVEQYRSLVINSAQWMDERLQQRGNGALWVDGAANSAITASPATVSFGISGVNADASGKLTLTNVGRDTDHFDITVFPLSPGPAPTVSAGQVTLGAGQSATLDLRFAAQGLPGGERNGLFIVRGAASGAQIYVPYWHGVPFNVPSSLVLVSAPESARAGATGTIYFRLVDRDGMAAVGPVPEITPTAESAALGAVLTARQSLDSLSPGLWVAQVRLRSTTGPSNYTIRAPGMEDFTLSILATP